VVVLLGELLAVVLLAAGEADVAASVVVVADEAAEADGDGDGDEMVVEVAEDEVDEAELAGVDVSG
jgi:hypothetical protein